MERIEFFGSHAKKEQRRDLVYLTLSKNAQKDSEVRT